LLNYYFFKKKFLNINIKKQVYKFTSSILYTYIFLYRFCIKFDITKLSKYILKKYFFNRFIRIYRPTYSMKNIQNMIRYFILYIKNSWITYRHFWGFSKFSKTRNNSKSSRQLSLVFRNFLFKHIFSKFYKKFNNVDKHLAMHLEFFNKLWFFQWRSEWDVAYAKFLYNFRITKRKKIKFGVYFSKKFRPLNFKFRKPKLNKKKVTFPRDNYNIGFFFNFSHSFRKKILHGKSVK
jgi:hypothetical protein